MRLKDDLTTSAYRPFGAFRFILAMMVLLQHGLLLLPGGARETFYQLELGAVAVAVFFALSGFIVAEATGSFYAGRPAAFLTNRVLRVVPPYLAALGLSVLVDSWLFAAGRLVPLDAPVMLPPWQGRVLLAAVLEIVPGLPAYRLSGQDFSFIPFAWTLRVEFAFYLVAFATCWLMVRGGAAAWRRAIGAAAFAAGYAAFGVFLVRHWLHGAAGGGLQLLNIPFFAFGVCAYLALRDGTRLARLHLLFVAALVPVAFVLCGERGHPVLAWQLPILAGLFVALLLLARAPSPRGWMKDWDRRLGELSYPLYISHGIVLTVLASASTARGLLPYVVSVPVALWLASALHALVERPLRAVRARVRGREV